MTFWLAASVGVVIAVATTLWRFQTPGHRLLPLFFLLLAFASLAYYLGFVHRGWNPSRFLAQAGAITLFALALLVGHVSRLDQAGVESIRGFIDPYPAIEDTSFLPATSEGQIQLWLARSPDPAAAVSAFYRRPEHHAGWDMRSGPPLLVLEREGYQLTVFISDNGQGGADIVYDLRRAP
jgi:hypothetical protein